MNGAGATLGAGHIAFAVTDDTDLNAWRTRLDSQGVEMLSEVVWEGGRAASISAIRTATYSNLLRLDYGGSVDNRPPSAARCLDAA
jgi:hypothetical protein